MFKRELLLITSFFVIGPTCLHGQWTPVKSNIRETKVVTKGNTTIKSEIREGVFYRTTDGSTLTHWIRINGVEQAGEGDLLDNRKLLTYRLVYGTREAFQSEYSLPEPLPPDIYAKELTSLGQGAVEGISCKLIPVSLELEKASERIGQACVSAQYGLLLKQETNVAGRNGERVHVVLEMYNIKLNAQPDLNEFDVDRNFKVSRPVQTKPAPELIDSH